MNILFLTLLDIEGIDNRNIYEDLLRKFEKEGHKIYIVSPCERNKKTNTRVIKNNNSIVLKVKTGNIQKTNIIEKGIATILLESQFIAAIRKNYSDIRFDLILYSTPPITLAGVVDYVKKRDNANTYLLLKDIFPQNAVDLGLLKKTGFKGVIYRYFRMKEKQLYNISDIIGCMSQANVDYVVKHNPDVDPCKIEICPNSIEPIDMSISNEERIYIREKYGIPQDKTVFVYGGNLGKPQGIPFLIKCLDNQKNNKGVFFLVVGSGTDYSLIEKYIYDEEPQNIRLMRTLPKAEFDKMIGSCDVGMIFLDHRFTIPNFPSRVLSYMQAGLPILAVTDTNTDIGKVITEGDFGWWCESNDVDGFSDMISKIDALEDRLRQTKGTKGQNFLDKEYSISRACRNILGHVQKKGNMELNQIKA